MTSIATIESMWAQDCVIEETNIVAAARKTPELHNKYYGMYIREQYVLEALANDVTEKEYYLDLLYQPNRLTNAEYDKLGWEPVDKCPPTASERNKVVALDKRMIDSKMAWARQKHKTEYLKEIVAQINNRNWTIRNLIEAKKFESGGF